MSTFKRFAKFSVPLLFAGTLFSQKKKLLPFQDLGDKHREFLFSKETDVFIWGKGNNKTGKGYKNFRPHLIKHFKGDKVKDVVDLKFNDLGCVAIDKQGNAFYWDEGQLNCHRSKKIKNDFRDKVVKIGSDIVQSSMTSNKIFLLNRQGEVSMIPLKVTEQPSDSLMEHHNPLPLVEVQTEKTVKVKELKDIKQISTGKDHFVCVNKEGKLFGMGDDSFGFVLTRPARARNLLRGEKEANARVLQFSGEEGKTAKRDKIG